MYFKEFFGISQIRTASDSNNRIKWVENDIHVIESGVRPYPGNEKKIRRLVQETRPRTCGQMVFQF